MDAKKTLKTVEFHHEPKNTEATVVAEVQVKTPGLQEALAHAAASSAAIADAAFTTQVALHQPSPREMFLEAYTYCPLCGDELIYTHNTHFVNMNVAEQAHCASCNVQTKNAQHQLH